MIDEKDIREKVDRRLSGLREEEARRMRIRAAINAERQAGAAVKRRISPALIFALAALLLMASIAIAEHLNLFSLFGRTDRRYANIAEQANLTATEAVELNDENLGQATAVMNSAFFDGQTLSLAFQIEQGVRYEAYTPEASELAGMTAMEAMPAAIEYPSAAGADILMAYNQAIANGTPFGYRAYTVYPSDHTLTDDGVDIPPYAADSAYTEDGIYAEMREFETPLPAGLAGRSELNLSIQLYRAIHTVYFDGQRAYQHTERTEAGEMTGTVPLTQGAVREMYGEGKINGVECRASARVSPMAAEITLSSEAPFLTFLTAPPQGVDPYDAWIELEAYDEAGRKYRAQDAFMPEEGCTESTMAFIGVGELPETLTLYVFSAWEGMDASEADRNGMTGIAMTVRKE